METLKPVKTAVVGCGMISNVYIRNLKNLFSIVDLVALCDVRAEAAREKARQYGVERTMTLDEVAASDEIEMVVNLTTPAVHYDVIGRMLRAGKHVFTEKTLTVNLEQARELVALAEEKKLYLGVAPDTVLGAGLQTARRLLDAGLIGTPTSCLASVNRNQALNSEAFGFIQNEGGSFPLDVGVYYVAALLSLLGPVRRVCGFAAAAPEHEAEQLFRHPQRSRWTLPGENLVTGSMEFASGVLGSIHFNGLSVNEEQSVLSIFGTKGVLQLGDPNSFNGFVRLVLPESEPREMPFTHGYNGVPTLENPTEFERGYGHRGVGAAEMAWAIRRARPNRLSKEFGFHTLEVLCGLNEAARSGGTKTMTTDFTFAPLPSGYYSGMFHGFMRADAERSLAD